jgi:hypothetical protein
VVSARSAAETVNADFFFIVISPLVSLGSAGNRARHGPTRAPMLAIRAPEHKLASHAPV